MAEGRIAGTRGEIFYRIWEPLVARRLVVIAHGYGEHAGRYEGLADALTAGDAAVYAPDHMGHGRSAGPRVLVPDFEEVVADLHQVVGLAQAAHPGLPLVLIGHSMGGLVATRYAQTHGEQLAGLVLSGPAIGDWSGADNLLALPDLSDVALDPTTLSRDPAVGEAYAADPLVHHGGFERATLEAWNVALAAIAAGPAFGELPLLWLHGEGDRLVARHEAEVAIRRLAGADFEEHVYPGAEHEVFNETNKDEVVAATTAFVERVTA